MLTWIFDFDGTLTNVNLGYEFSRWMSSTGRISIWGRAIQVIGAPINLVCRKVNRGQKILAWSFGLSSVERDLLFGEFLEIFDSKIVLNQAVLDLIKDSNGSMRVLLTGCHEELAKAFLLRRGIDEFQVVIGMTLRNTFLIKCHPFARSKVQLASNYSPYVGTGDSWTDRFFLEQATVAYVIGSDRKLNLQAEKRGWKIV